MFLVKNDRPGGSVNSAVSGGEGVEVERPIAPGLHSSGRGKNVTKGAWAMSKGEGNDSPPDKTYLNQKVRSGRAVGRKHANGGSADQDRVQDPRGARNLPCGEDRQTDTDSRLSRGKVHGGQPMPRLSLTLSEGTRERLERLSTQRKDKSLTENITHLIEEHFVSQLAANWHTNPNLLAYARLLSFQERRII